MRKARWQCDNRQNRAPWCRASWWLLALVLAPYTLAEEPAQPSVLLRNVYVPAHDMAAWPTNGEAYLPVDAERLEQLLAAANSAPQNDAQVLQTVLYASLDERDQLVGQGSMEVEIPADGQSWLRLKATRMGMTNPRWRKQNAPALVGYWGHHTAAAALVESDDWLDFSWHAAPTNTTSSAVEYRVELPASLSSVLCLDLAAGHTVEAIGAESLVIESTTDESLVHPLGEALPSVATGKSRWLLRSGADGEIRFRIRSNQQTRPRAVDTAAYHEHLSYRVSEGGVLLQQRFDILTRDELPRMLTLRATNGGVVRSASFDGEPLDLERTDAGMLEVALPLTSSEDGHRHQLVVEAWSTLSAAAAAPLPQVELPQLYWLSGELQVKLDSSLKLANLQLRDAVQVSPSAADGPASLCFQKTRSRGSVDLAVARRVAVNKIEIGRQLQLTSTGATAKVITHCSPSPSEPVRLLSAQLGESWQPQLVTTAAPYEVDEWYIQQHEDDRQLVVRVSIDPAKAASEGGKLELQIEATRSVPATDGYVPISTYDVLTWNDVDVAESWISFSAEDGYQLQFNPAPPAPDKSAPPELVPQIATARIFQRSALADNLRVFLGTAAAEFDARIVTTIVDRQRGWEIEHRIQCTPLHGSIQRLILATALAGQPDLEWKLAGEEQWRDVKPRSDIAATGGAANSDSVFELELPRRQATTFVVLIKPVRTTSSTCRPQPLELRDAREAIQWVKIRSPKSRNLSVLAGGWKMSRLEPDDSDIPLHSAWWSDQSSRPESLVVSPLEEPENLPLASVESAMLTSTFIPQTASEQRLELTIDNQSESQLVCTLPEQATNIRWHTYDSGGRPLASSESTEHVVSVPLGASSGRQSVAIEYLMPGQSLRHGERYTAAMPGLSIPAAETAWNVRTPRSYQLLPDGDSAKPIGWRTRLFGWLAPRPSEPDQSATPVGIDRAMHEVTLLFGPGNPASAKLIHRPTTQTRQCLWLVLFVGIGYWLWRTPSVLVVLFAVAVVAALLLPPATCGWGTSALGGLMLAVAVRTLGHATSLAREAWSDRKPWSLVAAATRTLLVMLLVLGDHSSLAGPAGRTIESCLIPVDEQGQLVGSQRYVTTRLLSELLRREGQQATADAWVVSSPRYTGSLTSSSNGASSTASVGRWQCAFDLDVIQAPATVRLPFELADATWSEVVLLDGVRLPLEWDEAGESLRFEVARPGRYRGKIEFQPMIQSGDSDWSVHLTVPPLPGGRLQLEAGSLANRLRVNGRLLTSSNGSSQAASLPLGCETSLDIAWPQEAAEPVAALAPVEQWAWLDVAADLAKLDVVFKVDAEQAEDFAPELTVDGHAEADSPPDAAWQWVAPPEVSTERDGSKQVRVRLQQQRSATYGRLLLPEIRLAGATVESCHVALDESSDVLVTLPGTVSDSSDRLVELAQYWPNRDEPSQLVAVDRSATALVANVAAVSTTARLEETLDVLATEEQLHVVYRGTIDYGEHETYSQWLSVSPDLELQSVELREEGASRKVDFARPEPENRVLVMFARPLSGSCELRLEGTISLKEFGDPQSNRGNIPRVTASLDTPVTQQIRLYAADSCTAELTEGEIEPQLAAAIPTPPANWQAYGVHSFMTTSDRTTPLEVRVGANRVRFDADVLTTMIRRDNSWIAEFGVLLSVAEGNLPEVVLDWPSTLMLEPDVDGSVKVAMENSPTSDYRRLHLRFDPAAMPSQQLRLTLRSSVAIQPSGEMVCPIVHVRDASNTRWYFGELADEAGQWHWQRVKPDVAPASIEGLLAAWPAARLLKASPTGTPVGIWTPKAANEQVHQLPLATIAVDKLDSGAGSVRTQLMVPPLELASLDIVVPDAQRVTQVTIDGAAAHVVPVAENRVRVDLPDAHLPHFVEVVTRLPAVESLTSVELPQLIAGGQPCEVQHMVWRASGLDREVALVAPDAEQLPAVDTAALRLNQLLTSSISTPTLASQPIPAQWAKRWMAELAAAESNLRRCLAERPESDPLLVSPDDATDEYDDLLTRATAEIKRTSAAAQLQVGSISAVSDLLKQDERSSQVFVQSGDNVLHWSEVRLDAADQLTRWGIALASVLAAGVFLMTRDRRWTLPISGYELLFPAVTLLGLAWWLCLWPRTVGLVLAVAALAAWIRWRSLKRRRPIEEASTISLSSRSTK